MWESLARVNAVVGGVVWGPVGLALLFGTGCLLTVRTGFFQLRYFGYWMRHTIGAIFLDRNVTAHTDDEAISQFQSLCTALAATIGTGQHRGCGGSHSGRWAGGCVLDVGHGSAGDDDQLCRERAGHLLPPSGCRRKMVRRAYVLSGRGAGRRLWPGTGGAVCLLLRAGQLRHGEYEPDQLHCGQSAGGVPGAAGGNGHRTGSAHRAGHTERAEAGGRSHGGHRPAHGPVLPVRSADRGLCPLGGCPGGIRGHLPGGVWLAGRRGRGAGLRHGRAISWGFKRGAFSNEAGLGASVLVHCAANVEEPVQQGMWGMFEVFADTMVVCTLTALVVLTSGLVDLDTGAALTGVEGSALVGQAFSTVFGAFGPQFIAVSVLLFAYSTTLGWSHYGTRAVVYLLGERAAAGYKLVFAAMVLVGAVMKLDLAWALSDTFNGLMMLPNLVGVVGLSGVVVRETQAYLKRK